MLTMPRALWRRVGRISSSKGSPQMEGEVLDFGSSAGEPVWKMKAGTMRCSGEPSYLPEAQRARKFYRGHSAFSGSGGRSDLGGSGHSFAEDFDFEVASVGVELSASAGCAGKRTRMGLR
jgi:hypothetical protein